MSPCARSLLSTLTLASLCIAVGASAEGRRMLRFDPFARPDLDALARASDPGDAYVSNDEWQPILSATLDSGVDSFATLGGIVLKIGEETHGYRLKEVRLWEATFERNGSNVTLSVEMPAAQAASP